jgi:hypothetical protein
MPGSWVVLGDDGKFWIYDNRAFQADFEHAERRQEIDRG